MTGGSAGPTAAPAANSRLVLNPTSGEADHTERVRRLAAEHGFSVVETERGGHASELAAAAAADDVDILAACGGDGTIHEVIQGLVAANALEDVTLAVIPAGTANIYASGLGIESVDDGFAAARRGATRGLDLGVADGEPFVLSAIAGLPASASTSASDGLKERIGTLAFVIEGVRTARQFDGLEVAVDVVADGEERVWEALCLLVGALRGFTGPNEPSNAETGRLEVTVVDRLPPTGAIAEAVERRFFDRETPHATTIEASELEIVSLEDEPVRFSLDGEPREYDRVEIGVRPGALRVCVGEAYASR
ncbi:diacylglycerol kinase family lipid kinase [Haloterrigena sp. SYSU A558-1]|uniref:Diacylglycerol kinase family lipid kinase n=1 Tax=Haloterrigena gelatinilytica TaxID=2741724 RepID=A0ABX2L7Y1_9EURY|nr:diacylglycerol kinase family protein [Haloterrigena gelatinilytica]NUC72322.1 diacylglycerol kinase family lipid kinase [Haloterrigena gelatinilytica]